MNQPIVLSAEDLRRVFSALAPVPPPATVDFVAGFHDFQNLKFRLQEMKS